MASIPTQFSSRILNFAKNYGTEIFVFGNLGLAHIWFFNFLYSDTMETVLEGEPKPFIKEYKMMMDKERRNEFFSSIKEKVKTQFIKDWNNTGIPALWNIIRPITVEAVETEE